MGYSKRIETICSLLKPATTFADVGCDHGYCSEYMLKNGLCEFAILSDISKGSLEKATMLLKDYVKNGKAKGILGNGFVGVPKDTQEVLIAGMGGEEIVAILSHERYGFMPEKFVFQPMLNPDKLRAYILDNGGFIERDYTFFADGKFYDVIVGRKRRTDEEKQSYNAWETEFGRDNIIERGEAFLARTARKKKDIDGFLNREGLQDKSREELLERKNRLQRILDNETD
ncbi:MAG: SAM-dependent methyltransferase [Clostridia bacterium]|nr:SAM-dependent methyltransferase [Clostridia bacterium]